MRKLLLLLTTVALTFGADMSAKDVMQKVKDRDKGQKVVSDLQMILVGKGGNKRIRSIKSYSLDLGDTTKKAIFFLSPADVANTAFLSYDYDGDKSDDQWMYLPALKKTKRIPTSDKSGSFMGSDFTNSDMTEPDIEAYNYKMIKETKFKGYDVYVIETTPKSQATIDETGYSKSEVYVRKDNFMVIAGKHYLANSNDIKLMQVGEFKEVGGIWFGTKMSMATKENGKIVHQTLMIQSNISLEPSLKEDDFSIRAIEKGL